ncbi:MAG: triose-phosphate isomerase [Rhodospirillaceae bacterium]
MIPLIAGNWKMNLMTEEAAAFASELSKRFQEAPEKTCDVLLCPSFISIPTVRDKLSENLYLGAQDCHFASAGAYTGDISCNMLRDVGCQYVILGHSERRSSYSEGNSLIKDKALAAISAGLNVIICVGETSEERNSGETLARISEQINGSLPERLSSRELTIAYEPVWAIGTGLTPTFNEIAEAHHTIRTCLARSVENPSEVRILYGGSMNPQNAKDILSIENVNGGLIGGASLKVDDFWSICACTGDLC